MNATNILEPPTLMPSSQNCDGSLHKNNVGTNVAHTIPCAINSPPVLGTTQRNMDMKKRISVAVGRSSEGVKIVEESYFSSEDTFCFACFLHYELETARLCGIDDDDADDSTAWESSSFFACLSGLIWLGDEAWHLADVHYL
jgi:hypothetical protein